MRLICPNCDAEYEVETALIPRAGRDVQCSNCGHSWFQMPPEIEAEAEAEAALYEDAPLAASAGGQATGDRDDAPPPVVDDQPVPVPEADLVPAADLEREADLEPAPVAVAPGGTDPAAAVARTLDETVLAVLREEAEREAAARRADSVARTPVMETQTEMGLQNAASVGVAGATARRLARLKGVDPDAPPPMPARPPTRREMLPEIDEINSSLRATSERRSGESAAVAATMPPPETGRRGFRNGFLLMVLVGLIGVVTYVMAPKIVERMPGAASAMTTYVGAVDSARLRLDASLQALIAALKSITRSES